MTNLNNLNVLASFKRNTTLIEKIIHKYHIVVEVVDCRLYKTTSELFDYKNLLRKEAIYIVFLSFTDLISQKQLAAIHQYFKEKKVPYFDMGYFNNHDFSHLLTFLEEQNQFKLDFHPSSEHNLKVIVLGVPKVGKKSFINKLIDVEEANNHHQNTDKVKRNVSLFKKMVFKNHNYFLNSNKSIVLTDAVPVLPSMQESHNHKLLKISLLYGLENTAYDDVTLAAYAVRFLAKFFYGRFNVKYKFNFSPNNRKLFLKENNLNPYFEAISVKINAENELGNVDLELATKCLIKDIRTGAITDIIWD